MKKLLQYGVAMAAAGLLANTVSAQSFGTLADLIASGQPIQVGDKIFDDFSWSPSAGGAPASSINVSLGQSGDDYFIEFQGPMSSGVGGTADIGLQYSVRTSSGLPLIAS